MCNKLNTFYAGIYYTSTFGTVHFKNMNKIQKLIKSAFIHFLKNIMKVFQDGVLLGIILRYDIVEKLYKIFVNTYLGIII